MSKATYLKYKEVNCTEPSPLVRVPFSYQYNHYFATDWQVNHLPIKIDEFPNTRFYKKRSKVCELTRELSI